VSEGQSWNLAARYALLAGVTAVVALAGYSGYVLYPRFDLPPATGATLLLLAAAAGIASFFSPCSFPLAVTLLARQASPAEGHSRLTRSTLWIGLGAISFLMLAGLTVAAGAGAFFKEVTFTSTAGITIRAVVGTLLILLGLMQLNVLPVSFVAIEDLAKPLLGRQARARREHPGLAFGLFGFGYLLAGFG
jgi:cytochrome c-type biogenesis protein